MENKTKPPPTPCIWCKEPNCNDWMYHAGLVPADQAICGKCKIDFGKKFIDGMTKAIKKEVSEKSE